MQLRVLALLENNIGIRLLLSTRLKALGFQPTIVSAPTAFREMVEADSFDWIILDAAVLPRARRGFLDHLQRQRKQARVVWCGDAPRRIALPIDATFDKPLRYDVIARFFREVASRDQTLASGPEAMAPGAMAGKPEGPIHHAEVGMQKIPGETCGVEGRSEGDGEP